MEEFKTYNIERVLKDFANEYVEKLKKVLMENGHKATGDLINSLITEIEATATTLKVVLFSEDYLKYVDFGRPSGKRPPKEKIEKWVKAKDIQRYPDEKTGKLPTEEQLIFLIQRSIGKKGTLKEYGYGGKGGQYSDKILEELYTKYAPLLEEAMWEDFAIEAEAQIDWLAGSIKI